MLLFLLHGLLSLLSFFVAVTCARAQSKPIAEADYNEWAAGFKAACANLDEIDKRKQVDTENDKSTA
jgi:hypothetical protein